MVMEWMGAWEMVAGPRQKGSIMKICGVGIGSANPGITFATIGHPNSIKAMNSTNNNTGSVLKCIHFGLVATKEFLNLGVVLPSSISL